MLDQSLGKGFEIVGTCFQKADEAGWNMGSVLGWVIAGLVVATGTVLVAMFGGAIIIVANMKNSSPDNGMPTVNIWCAHTMNDRKAILAVAYTMAE